MSLCNRCKFDNDGQCDKHAVTEEEYQFGVEQCYRFKVAARHCEPDVETVGLERYYNNSRGV